MVILVADTILDFWTGVLDVDSLLVPLVTGSGVDMEFLSSLHLLIFKKIK